jgi:hypothetical protein
MPASHHGRRVHAPDSVDDIDRGNRTRDGLTVGSKLERWFLTSEVAGIAEFLFCFLFQTPNDSERVSTFAGADESALFHRLDGIAIGRQRAYFFIIFQPSQNWVAAERISFKLVSVLDVRK